MRPVSLFVDLFAKSVHSFPWSDSEGALSSLSVLGVELSSTRSYLILNDPHIPIEGFPQANAMPVQTVHRTSIRTKYMYEFRNERGWMDDVFRQRTQASNQSVNQSTIKDDEDDDHRRMGMQQRAPRVRKSDISARRKSLFGTPKIDHPVGNRTVWAGKVSSTPSAILRKKRTSFDSE